MKPQQNNRTALRIVGIVTIVLAVALTVFVVWHDMRKDSTDKPTTSTESSDQSQGEQSMQSERIRLSKNVERQNDAQILAAAVNNYANNNSGRLPTDWQDKYLVGANDATTELTDLKLYQSVLVAEAPQSALTTDAIRLVLHGTCNKDGTTARGTTVTGYAVQYSELVNLTSGTTEGKCINQ
jgi:hypothetical protein